MHTDKHGLLKLAALIFIIIGLITGCNGADESALQLEDQIAAATGGLEVKLKECRGGMESAQGNNAILIETNALLIETNARLTLQLDAGKLDQLAAGADLKDRLSECEFLTRELEDETVGKQDQITVLEMEIADYSIEIRSVLEEKHALIEKQQFALAEDDAVRFEMESLADEFAVEFEVEIEKELAAFEITDRFVSLMLRNALLFKPGTVEVTKKATVILGRVSEALKSLEDFQQWEITVAGHTDDIAPGKTLRRKYPTNWEMSQARAASVVRYLIKKEGFPPGLLGAMGYGQFRPVASNGTRPGRAKNLRIEITVVPIPKAEEKEQASKAE